MCSLCVFREPAQYEHPSNTDTFAYPFHCVLQIKNDRRLAFSQSLKRYCNYTKCKRLKEYMYQTRFLESIITVVIKVNVTPTVNITGGVKFILPQNIRDESLVKPFHPFVSRI